MRRHHDRVLRELTLAGRTFQLLERLSSGSRERYRAFDPVAGPNGDYRAILVLSASPETTQHLSVLQQLANTRNENVPFLVESHLADGVAYVVLAWVPGTPLDVYLGQVAAKRIAPPSALHACKLIRGLTHGLCQLHHRWNVNHGDIKPSNLILGGEGRYLASIDFGSAWLTPQTSVRTAGDGVSGAYSAPELLIAGAVPSFRSDQFSVSVVWYELLTGKLPYDGVGGRAGLPEFRSAMERTLIPPSRLASTAGNVPRGLWKLVDRTVCQGLSVDADRRFADKSAWLDPLDEIHHEFQRRKSLRGWNRKIADLLGGMFGFPAGRSSAPMRDDHGP